MAKANDFMSVFESFQKGTIAPEERKYVSTGIRTFDLVLSGGRGIPLGAYVELSSESGCGKTTLMLEVSRTFCEMGKRVLYIDVESGVSDDLMTKMGLVDFRKDKKFLYISLNTFNAVGKLLDSALTQKDLSLIVLDSLTMLTPDELLDDKKQISDCGVGIHSRYTGNLLSRFRQKILNSEKTIVFINQMRNKIPTGYGQQAGLEPAGGQAQKFAQDVRIQMRRGKSITDGDRKIGSEIYMLALKNRLGGSYKTYQTMLYFGKGIDDTLMYRKWMEDNGLIEMKAAGSYVVIWNKEEIKIRGTDNVTDYVRQRVPEIKKLMAKTGNILEENESFDTENETDEYDSFFEQGTEEE